MEMNGADQTMMLIYFDRNINTTKIHELYFMLVRRLVYK